MRLDRQTIIGMCLAVAAIGIIAFMCLESWEIAGVDAPADQAPDAGSAAP